MTILNYSGRKPYNGKRSATRGPIPGRHPSTFHQKAAFTGSQRKWVRSKDSGGSSSQTGGSDTQPAPATNTEAKQTIVNKLTEVDNQKQPSKPPSTLDEARNPSSNDEKKSASTTTITSIHKPNPSSEKVDEESPQKSSVLRRVGSNKLVLKGSQQSQQKQRPTNIGNNKLQKVGDGQFVAHHHQHQQQQPHQRWKQPRSQSRPPYPPHKRHAAPPSTMPKRILIVPKSFDEEDKHGTGGSDKSTDNQAGDTPTSNAQAFKLTDFAYKETHRVVQNAGNKRWTAKSDVNNPHTESGGNTRQAGPRSMGLVRLRPNESKTPVCTTFLKGINCDDPYCRKRHDIPKEFAMPICSFFQRQGQCLKGDECPFRHVKVNPSAIICSTFAVLGYCQDRNCIMKHMVASKGTQNKVRAHTKSYNRKYKK